jgi:prevent-host-death family protein
MPKTTQLSSREFNQDTARAKREASKGPVFITDRGETRFVLIGIEEYRRLTEPSVPFAQRIGDSAAAAIELKIPARSGRMRSVAFD